MNTSQINRSTAIPEIGFPAQYNAAHDLLECNKAWPDKTAFINSATAEKLSYRELRQQAHRWAHALRSQGFEPEQRILLCMLDTPEWPVAFLGCILAGVVPIAVNTMLTTSDFEYMLRDSRAKGLITSPSLLPTFLPLIDQIETLKHVYLGSGSEQPVFPQLKDLIAQSPASEYVCNTQADDACFWLYSSGSTGMPKGTVHLHSHLMPTAVLYAQQVLGIRHDDVVYSAGKLFFAYGLGNSLTFPMSVGATTVLLPGRPTSADVFDLLKTYQPTLFYGVPTLYASLLADAQRPQGSQLNLRLCTSAGEALPAEIGKAWSEQYGCEILDGIGSTELLHIFISNKPGEVRYGTTGKPVPGYQVRLINDDGNLCAPGELGELQIKGPSAALYYWNQRAKTKATFTGEWTRSGDKYTVDEDGYYTYGGRSDDMLKVGGIYVSPFEVEASLMTHADVLEAAVIGLPDGEGLTKPKAFVVLKQGRQCSPEDLQLHVKKQLAPYKYPRWIEIVQELPKTATGKIQRFKLRRAQP
jgi:benzoate-CoA ligase